MPMDLFSVPKINNANYRKRGINLERYLVVYGKFATRISRHIIATWLHSSDTRRLYTEPTKQIPLKCTWLDNSSAFLARTQST